jgi:hypothetical protein
MKAGQVAPIDLPPHSRIGHQGKWLVVFCYRICSISIVFCQTGRAGSPPRAEEREVLPWRDILGCLGNPFLLFFFWKI